MTAAAVVAALVLLAALAAAGGRPAPSVQGLPDAGPVTGWALPAVRLVLHAAAVVTVGALLLVTVLLPPAPVSSLSALSTSVVRSGAWTAGLWSVSAGLLLVLTASETVGAPLTDVTTQDLLDTVAAGTGRALLLVAGLATAVAIGAARARTTNGGRGLLLLAGLGLLPPTLTGHAASAGAHELAVTSLVVHVLAATVWVGGLLALLLFLRRPSDLARAVPRFSAVALACFVLVALSGALSAYERLGLSGPAWTSGYGGLVVLKLVLLGGLAAMGWRHRRRLLPALGSGRPGAFLSFAGVEVCVMGSAFALAVALSRTPTPARTGPVVVASHGAGHETLPDTVDPVSLTGLLLEWRINAVVLAVVGLLACAYAAGVRRARVDGTPWPGRRSAAFAGGLVAAVVALSSGVATYAAAMLSVQVAQFVLLLVLTPALLVLGAPLELLDRVRAPGRPAPEPERRRSRVLSTLTDPLTAMVLVAGLVFVVYRTEVLDRTLGSSGLLLGMNTAALAVGWLLLWPALALRRSRGERVVPVVAAAVTLALLAVELRSSDQLTAGRWFAALGWSWVDPAADQRLAALFAAAGAGLLLVLAAAAWRAPSPSPSPYPDEPGRGAAGCTLVSVHLPAGPDEVAPGAAPLAPSAGALVASGGDPQARTP